MTNEKPILYHPTPLHGWTAEHVRGNTWAPWFGYSAAAVYGDVVGEAGALARGVGIADFTPHPAYEISGIDAVTYLDRLLTRSASAMEVGEVREALICVSSGHVISRCTLMRIEDTRFLLMAAGEVGARLLEGRANMNVTIERSSLVSIGLFGPARGEILSDLGVNLGPDEDGFVTMRDHKGVSVIIVDAPASTAPGGGGSFIMVAPDDAGLQWERLMGKGQGKERNHELTPVGLDALERCRIDLGVARAGAEFRSAHLARKAHEKVLPNEIGLAHLVVHDGRIFTGAHALNEAKGKRRLVRLEVDRVAAILGEVVRVGDLPAGRVTSAYEAPELGITKALALIEGDAGKNLSIGFESDPITAFVVSG